MDTLLAAQQNALDGLHARLYGRGLLGSPARDQRQRSAGDRLYSAAWLLVLLWGAMGLVQGWQRGHSGAMLVVLLVIAGMPAVWLHCRLPHRRTREGHIAVRQARRNLHLRRPLTSADPLMPLGLALLGPTALGGDLAQLRKDLGLLKARDAGGSGCGGGSCGSTGDGGDGGDGGCGGGGD